jgi:hypothetical protein
MFDPLANGLSVQAIRPGSALVKEPPMLSEPTTNGSRQYLSYRTHHRELTLRCRIRQVNVSDEQRIWRDFRFGDLVDLVALDTRK